MKSVTFKRKFFIFYFRIGLYKLCGVGKAGKNHNYVLSNVCQLRDSN